MENKNKKRKINASKQSSFSPRQIAPFSVAKNPIDDKSNQKENQKIQQEDKKEKVQRLQTEKIKKEQQQQEEKRKSEIIQLAQKKEKEELLLADKKAKEKRLQEEKAEKERRQLAEKKEREIRLLAEKKIKEERLLTEKKEKEAFRRTQQKIENEKKEAEKQRKILLQKERQKAREEQEKILQKQKEIALQKKQAIQKIKEEKAKLVAKKKAIRQEQKKQIKEAKEKEEQKYLAVVRTGRHKKYAFMPLFSPTVRMCIDCTNQPRTINAFQSAGIRLHHVHQHKDAKLELSIKKKDQQKAFATLQKLCYNYTITAESGIQTLPRTLFRHLGYVAGALFFAFVLIFSHQFVWKIDIKGNDRVDSQLILRQLKEIGVSVGGGKQQIDPVKVATALRSDPDIAETTVEVKGTTVFVTIVESKQYIPPTASKNPNNITSYYDAVITRMTVKSGTATHKAGDSVAAGEILVKGVRLSSNGELLQKVEAKGEIYGRVTFKDTFVFSQIEKKIVRTGKKKVFTNLKLFSWQIGKKPNSNEQEVSVAKLFLLPIQVERTIVYETITEETPRDIEAYSTELANETLLKYGLSTGENTKTSATLTKLENGFIMVNVYIESEVKIGEN